MIDDFPAMGLAIPGLNDTDPGDDQPVRVSRNLTQCQKAAVIVRLLISEGFDLPLEELPEQMQASLTKEMGDIGLVDRMTLSTIVDEFSDALDGVGLAFPHGLVEALNVMDGKISAHTASRLRKEAGVRQSGDPWKRLREIAVNDLIDLVENESIEVAAVLLSKLDVHAAAELLGLLPGPVARRITFAVGQTRNISAEAVERIGMSLATQLNMRPTPVFSVGPGERVGAILNLAGTTTRRDMLDGLDEHDPDFANSVRAAIFTYEDIPDRLARKDIGRLISMIDQRVLITALAASDRIELERTADYIMNNITARMAGTLKEEIRSQPMPDEQTGETAMAEVILTIQKLASLGEITLKPS
jgi:flagellar motor switch protein FliG